MQLTTGVVIGKKMRITYDSNGNIEYIGLATPGTDDKDSGWQIIKFVYDASQNLTHILYAEGNTKYDKVFSNRQSYSYS